ncbi:uncharacterized protein PG986_010635 [Apiospora aurea]|uniref:Uncharacterized protein n=1 Tax=Apiospora aurea TaxID=335848 RepID=A0ABR1Q3I7_9PEZI
MALGQGPPVLLRVQLDDDFFERWRHAAEIRVRHVDRFRHDLSVAGPVPFPRVGARYLPDDNGRGAPSAGRDRLQVRAARSDGLGDAGVPRYDGDAVELFQLQRMEIRELDNEVPDVLGVAADPLEEHGDLVGLDHGEVELVLAVEHDGGLVADLFAHAEQLRGGLVLPATVDAGVHPGVEGFVVGDEAVSVNLGRGSREENRGSRPFWRRGSRNADEDGYRKSTW